MPTTSFLVDCEPGLARYRVRFVSEKGKVLEFVVQLECWLREEWRPVIRFDTAHGFAHFDAYGPEGQVKAHQPMEVGDYNQALTLALTSIRNRWPELILPFQGEASS